jgi:hypothetical protein
MVASDQRNASGARAVFSSSPQPVSRATSADNALAVTSPMITPADAERPFIAASAPRRYKSLSFSKGAKMSKIRKRLKSIDPGTWVAIVALVLTQVPSIGSLIDAAIHGTHVTVSFPDSFQLMHFLGNPGAILPLSIRNSGGTKATISSIDCVLQRPGQQPLVLRPYALVGTRGTSQAQVQGMTVPTIDLDPGDFWNGNIQFYSRWSQKTGERQNRVAADMRSDLNRKTGGRPVQSLVTLDDSRVKEATSIFDENFKLISGDYLFLLRFVSNIGKQLGISGFRFSLTDTSIRALRSTVDDYKYGVGVIIPDNDPGKVVQVSVEPITDREASREFEARQTK